MNSGLKWTASRETFCGTKMQAFDWIILFTREGSFLMLRRRELFSISFSKKDCMMHEETQEGEKRKFFSFGSRFFAVFQFRLFAAKFMWVSSQNPHNPPRK